MLDISAEQMLIIREFIYHTKLGQGMDTWAGQARDDLAVMFEQLSNENSHVEADLGRPEIVVTASFEDGIDFQLR